MSGRKYIGEIIFDQQIDKLSKSKKDSLKREIYNKMCGNEFFIKNISVGSGNLFSYKNKNIKLKGDKAFIHFKKTMIPYKKKSKEKSLFNWAQKNFKRSMNFDKKLFLDGSLKAIRVCVKKDNKTKRITKKRTKKHKNSQNGGIVPIAAVTLAAAGAAGAVGLGAYGRHRQKKNAAEEALLDVGEGVFTVGEGDFNVGEGGFTVGNEGNEGNEGNGGNRGFTKVNQGDYKIPERLAPEFVPLSPFNANRGHSIQGEELKKLYKVEYVYRGHGENGRGFYKESTLHNHSNENDDSVKPSNPGRGWMPHKTIQETHLF